MLRPTSSSACDGVRQLGEAILDAIARREHHERDAPMSTSTETKNTVFTTRPTVLNDLLRVGA